LQQQQQSKAGGRGPRRQLQQHQEQQHAGDPQSQPDESAGPYVFSIRPSVLSPLHPYFRYTAKAHFIHVGRAPVSCKQGGLVAGWGSHKWCISGIRPFLGCGYTTAFGLCSSPAC
jgi:hypothetical protein